jgi:hypothetical protein
MYVRSDDQPNLNTLPILMIAVLNDTSALLDGTFNRKTFQVMCHGCRINSHAIATLCGERYLSDEIINSSVL